MIGRRPLLKSLAALPLSLALPRPARAAAGKAGADLARLPSWAFAAAGAPVTGWCDVQAARQVIADPPGTAAFWLRFAAAPAVDQIGYGLDGGWASRVGFGPQDILRSSLGAAAPAQAMVLDLAPGKGEAVTAALLAHGYARAERDGVTALARGDEDFAISLAARDPADPFGGMLGKSSRVVVRGDTVMQAPDWPGLIAMAGGPATGHPTGHPALAEMDEALTHALFGGAPVLQCVILPAQAALSDAPLGSGLPPWLFCALADLSDGKSDQTAALFLYADAAEAGQAAAVLARHWAETPLATRRTLEELTGPVETAVQGRMVIARAIHPAGGTAPGLRAVASAGWQRGLIPFGL